MNARLLAVAAFGLLIMQTGISASTVDAFAHRMADGAHPDSWASGQLPLEFLAEERGKSAANSLPDGPTNYCGECLRGALWKHGSGAGGKEPARLPFEESILQGPDSRDIPTSSSRFE